MKIKINNIEKLKGEKILIRHTAGWSPLFVTYLCERTVENTEKSPIFGWIITLDTDGYVVIMDEVDEAGKVKVAMKSSGWSMDIMGAWIRLEELQSMDRFVKALGEVIWE